MVTRDRNQGRDNVLPLRPADADPADADPAEAPVTEAAATEATEATGEAEEPAPEKTGKQEKPAVAESGEQRRAAVVPAHFQRGQIRQTAADFAAETAYRARFHGIRAPFLYAPGSAWYAARGIGRLASRWGLWVTVPELKLQESAAAAKGLAAFPQAMQAHKEGNKTRGARWKATGCCAAAAGLASAAVAAWVPWEAQYGIAAAAYGVLAHQGRPLNGPMIPRAILPPSFQVPTLEVITQALDDIGIAKLSAHIKARGGLDWVIDLYPDGDGWSVEFDAPKGVTATTIVQKRSELSSALRRPISAVWPQAVPGEHDGRVHLWIGRRDFGKMKPQKHPMLKTGTTDVFAGVPFGYLPWGAKITAPIFETNWLIIAAMGGGKALALDTPVPTPTGFTTMGELRDGDALYGSDGRPCKVVKAWPVRHGRPCYEVEFSDGTVITADAEHLWMADSRASRISAQKALKSHHDPHWNHGQQYKRIWPKVMNTAEMAESQRTKEGWVNYSVRVAAPLQAPDAELPVPPYTLGAWLGDGTSAKGEISSQDPEIIAAIESEGEACTPVVTPSQAREGRCPLYRVSGLVGRLRQAGVYRDKHIPVTYLRASEDQRRALLAGLLDTDGYCQVDGGVVFGVTSERLARDTHHLIASLGYKVTLSSKPARLYGKDCGTQWLVSFTPADKVFRLTRKASRQATKTRATYGHRYITAIREVPSVPVRCITVDSPDSLYLVTESCISTHNTAAIRTILAGVALDTVCDLWIHEHSGKGDLKSYAQVAHRYTSGVDDEAIAYTAESLKKLRGELTRRQKIFKQVPDDQRQHGSVTRELATADKRMRPVVMVVDEVHNALQHPQHGAQIATDMEYVMRLGRAYGIVFIIATQRNGAGSIPPIISAVITVRFCLKVNDHVTNDMALNAGAFKAGHNAVIFRREIDAGQGWLLGAGEPAAPKTYYTNLTDANRITARARVLREKAGVLSGYAIGEEEDQGERSLLADVLSVFGPAEKHLYWETVATRLAGRYPGTYTGLTSGAVSADMRTLTGRPADQGREPGGPNLNGIRRTTIDDVLSGTPSPVTMPPAYQPEAAPGLEAGLLAEAAEFIITAQYCTAETLTRKFRLKAAEKDELLRQLEERDIIAAAVEGSKQRDVLKRPDELAGVLSGIGGWADA